MKINEKIKTLRKKFGLKQLDFANSLNVTPQAVSKWECGENYPDIFILKKIANLFDVTIDYLLGTFDDNRDVFDATVFCSSINQFAKQAETLSAKDLAQWTNAVFHSMTVSILKHGGVPVKYTGDGFLCFFSGVEHRDRALKAAKEMDRVNHDKDLIIFLHSGEIYFGMIGHPDYASRDIYGDTVNKSFLMMNSFADRAKRGIGVTREFKTSLKMRGQFKKYNEFKIPHLKETQAVYRFQK